MQKKLVKDSKNQGKSRFLQVLLKRLEWRKTNIFIQKQDERGGGN